MAAFEVTIEVMPEAVEKAIRELPLEAAVIELFNNLVGTDPLPTREGSILS